MSQAATLYFFCGKMASGKSTLARTLAVKHSAILLIEDALLEKLYAQEIADIADYIEYSSRLKDAIFGHVKALLSHGVSVVMDFPANTREQREWFKRLLEKTPAYHELHFVDASDALCKQQLGKRSKNKPEGTAFTSAAEFDAITRYFQPPSANEEFNLVIHHRS